MDFVAFDPNTVLPNLSQLSISLGKSNMNTGYTKMASGGILNSVGLKPIKLRLKLSYHPELNKIKSVSAEENKNIGKAWPA